jgi:8-oxo-dGTP pyrophosphatase MutT (NUDIX family)
MQRWLEAFMGRKQFAALPFRVRESGVQIMLITTRRKRRWSLPKGSPMGKKKPHRVAAIEAYEEAGLAGAIGKRALGHFQYSRQRGGKKQAFEVAVFPLKVEEQMTWWPEKGQRQAIWLPASIAARRVHRTDLRRLIDQFAEAGEER